MNRFLMPRDGEENSNNSPRIEPKRNHQLIIQDVGLDLSGNKKPALEAVHRRPVLEIAPWNIMPGRSGILDSVRKDFEEQYLYDQSVGFSMSPTEDRSSHLNIGKESDNVMPISEGHSSYQIHCNKSLMGDMSDSNSISLGVMFSEDTASTNSVYGNPYEKFLPMGQNLNKGKGSVMSTGSSFDNNGLRDVFPMTHDYSEVYEIYKNFNLKDLSPIATTDNEVNVNVVLENPTSDNGELNIVPAGEHFNENENNTVADGSSNEDSDTVDLGGITNSCDAGQLMQVPDQTDIEEPNALPVENDNTPRGKSRRKRGPKRNWKEANMVGPTNFPLNVKSLLSTGILDGVQVKYASWSREKSLRGIIKGSGYMCGCSDCKYMKFLNAYEFEAHAGCNTKHPNDRIFFQSGKTIFAVVQELKNTPHENLFDTIQTITGSAINQKNFETWKVSYTAAIRELQRIYGKDEVASPSKD